MTRSDGFENLLRFRNFLQFLLFQINIQDSLCPQVSDIMFERGISALEMQCGRGHFGKHASP